MMLDILCIVILRSRIWPYCIVISAARMFSTLPAVIQPEIHTIMNVLTKKARSITKFQHEIGCESTNDACVLTICTFQRTACAPVDVSTGQWEDSPFADPSAPLRPARSHTPPPRAPMHGGIRSAAPKTHSGPSDAWPLGLRHYGMCRRCGQAREQGLARTAHSHRCAQRTIREFPRHRATQSSRALNKGAVGVRQWHTCTGTAHPPAVRPCRGG
jgi:hypothetical protein